MIPQIGHNILECETQINDHFIWFRLEKVTSIVFPFSIPCFSICEDFLLLICIYTYLTYLTY